MLLVCFSQTCLRVSFGDCDGDVKATSGVAARVSDHRPFALLSHIPNVLPGLVGHCLYYGVSHRLTDSVDPGRAQTFAVASPRLPVRFGPLMNFSSARRHNSPSIIRFIEPHFHHPPFLHFFLDSILPLLFALDSLDSDLLASLTRL